MRLPAHLDGTLMSALLGGLDAVAVGSRSSIGSSTLVLAVATSRSRAAQSSYRVEAMTVIRESG
jgi:hypothetical protein